MSAGVNSKRSTMKNITLLVAAIVLCLSSDAFARIGQTEEQVSALFGKPIDAGTPDKEGVTTNMYKNSERRVSRSGPLLKITASPKLIREWMGAKLSGKRNVRSFSREISGGKEWIKDPSKLAGKKRSLRKGVHETLPDDRPCLSRRSSSAPRSYLSRLPSQRPPVTPTFDEISHVAANCVVRSTRCRENRREPRR